MAPEPGRSEPGVNHGVSESETQTGELTSDCGGHAHGS